MHKTCTVLTKSNPMHFYGLLIKTRQDQSVVLEMSKQVARLEPVTTTGCDKAM